MNKQAIEAVLDRYAKLASTRPNTTVGQARAGAMMEVVNAVRDILDKEEDE